MSGSGISWDICKSAPRSRQITTPASNHSVFYRPDALPAAQPTVLKHWRPLLLVVTVCGYNLKRKKNNKPSPELLTLLICFAAVYFPAATRIALCRVCVPHPTSTNVNKLSMPVTPCTSQSSSGKTLVSQNIMYKSLRYLRQKAHLLLPASFWHCDLFNIHLTYTVPDFRQEYSSWCIYTVGYEHQPFTKRML